MIQYFIIHCKRHRERLLNISQVANNLSQYPQILEIIEGVDATNIKSIPSFLENFPEITLMEKNDFNSNGEYGCYLSHFNILKKISGSEKSGYSVIFEDDVMFKPYLHGKIEKIISDTKGEFDMIFLGNYNDKRGDIFINNIYEIDKRNFLWGTHALLINNKNVSKIYESTLNMEKAIDNQYKKYIDNGDIKAYVIYPNICFQNKTFKSTILRDKVIENKINLYYAGNKEGYCEIS